MRVFGRNSTMRKPANCVLVIFGASGDLTHRKLMPALYNLYRRELMPDQFAVVGTGRTKLSDDDFRANMAKAINTHSDADCDLVDRFLDSVFYQPVDTTTRLRRSKFAIPEQDLWPRRFVHIRNSGARKRSLPGHLGEVES